MYELIDVLISGVTNGSVYAMMAIGLSLVYGVTKVFNFAYGSLYTLGGYLAFTFFGYGFGYPLVILLTLVALYAAGLITERVVIRPLRRRDDWEMLAMMVTLGLAIFLDNLFQVVYGPYVKSLPIMFSGNLQLAGFVISTGVESRLRQPPPFSVRAGELGLAQVKLWRQTRIGV